MKNILILYHTSYKGRCSENFDHKAEVEGRSRLKYFRIPKPNTFYYYIIEAKEKKSNKQTLGSFVVISFFTFAQVATSAAAIMEKNKHKSGGVNKN